jgi:ABC-type multidrug transport system ATPase subunit
MLIVVMLWLGWQFAQAALGYRTSAGATQFFVNIFPTWAMNHASELISNAGVGDFKTMSGVRLGFHNIGWSEAHPLAAVFLSMLFGSILWMLIAIYCDLVLPIGPGLKRHPLFMFLPSTYAKSTNTSKGTDCALPSAEGEPSEVTAERQRVLSQEGGVRALGLSKTYPGAHRAAVVNVQFGIHESECFGLLGSNGAGKSTTIHILCGLHPATTGTVICGDKENGGADLDIRTELSTIQSAMGVCSQDNLLWDDLTGGEHLKFFARLRRVAPKSIKHHIDFWLRRVNLARPADKRKRSRSYSGGMKRRLGVANAFIGNPKLVYLDEPSTGLDPESRQQLWRAVLAAKPSKSIILTTHALEEAEALCDRVGIMTFGLMRTIGTPTELRLRFDQGYKFLLACEPGYPVEEEAAAKYVLTLLPQARLVDAINGVRTYIVPKGAVKMSALFEGMEASKSQYKIKDWGLSHTSLEEVFLHIVAANSLKAADAS